MTLQEAIKLLTEHQLWRLGNDDYPMQVPSEITEALDIVLNYCVGALELPQQEISDEEILKIAKECILEDLHVSVGSFELGAKWYREQLKQRQ
jgi:hypothetical protein